MCKFVSRALFLVAVIFNFGCGFTPQQTSSSATASPERVGLTISPVNGSIQLGTSQQFTAKVSGTPEKRVNWTATNGSINSDGVFTASGVEGDATVTASLAADAAHTAESLLTVTNPAGVSIKLTPSAATIQVGEPQQFSATIINSDNRAVTWSSSGVGAVDGSGLFISSITGAASVTVTSVADPTKFATAQLIIAPPQPRSFDGPAELPRRSPPSLLANTPAPGIVTMVPLGSDLQAAINSANCGDTLQLEAGATFNGNFLLPAKSCDDSHWIIIRSGAADESFPAEGKRITPCYAGVASLPGRPAFKCNSAQKLMATLMGGRSAGPITLSAGASHYRLGPGLELTRPLGTGIHYGLIAKNADDPADHIIVDRDWIHGTAVDETARGFFMSGIVYAAVVDSYFSDFHCTAVIGTCIDAQAIAGGTGDLPQGDWKIENNFLEGAAETILFGGAGGTAVPTDITIRFNHMFKPLNWMPGQPNFVGATNTDPTKCVSFKEPGQCPFVVKNLFELKNAQRVLLAGNILENSWAGYSQYGNAILLQALNQTGSNNPNTTVSDVTVRYNRVSHAAIPLSVDIVCLSCTTNPAFAGRVSVHDDIFDDLNAAVYGFGDIEVNTAKPFQISQCESCAAIKGVNINHVTLIMKTPRIFMVLGDKASTPIQGVNISNSIISSLPGTVITAEGNGGPCAFSGVGNLARLNNCLATPYRVTANALIAATGTWPSGNFFPADPTEVQFDDYNNGNGGDYHLLLTSPFKNAGTDGKDLGANVDMVQASTANVQ